MKYHLKFRNIRSSVVRATEELFESGPWSGTDEDRFQKFARWLVKASRGYGVPTPTLEVRDARWLRTRLGVYRPGSETRGGYDLLHENGPIIYLSKYSVLTLFHEFRHHLQEHGFLPEGNRGTLEECENDARGWSCSLFYKVKPRYFRKLVREGKIMYMSPNDLRRVVVTPNGAAEPGTEVQVERVPPSFIHTQSERPLDALQGAARVDRNTNTTYVWDGTLWVEASELPPVSNS